MTVWNEITLRAVTAGRPSPAGFLDIALVQAAVHDAVQAFERRFEPYHVAIPDAVGSPEAAVAAAAALLTQYRPAPNPPLPPYTGGTGLGMWRPTPSDLGNPPSPPPFSPMAILYLATTQPFTLLRPSQFRPQPPHLESERYRRDYDEVKAYGARFSSVRTAAQTDMAYFWSDNVVVQWNQALRAIAEAKLTTLGDSARLLALANLATADALIACWDTKYHFSFWRPITAIHEGDADGNPMTQGDPSWQPLLNTPNYPDYSSGANNVSGAMTGVLARFFGTDEIDFAITSNAANVIQRTRTYQRISAAAREVVEARMMLGFHFRFADEEALRQGTRVAHWASTKFLRPLHGAGQ